MKRPRIMSQQSGFTLIEIIAVLILLGILAAVAVPKFINLQDDAELKAVAGVKAELTSRANQYFARYLLDNTKTENAQALADWGDPAKEDLGNDFTVGVDGTKLSITVASTGNVYLVDFTQGVNATDNTGKPAAFGAIAKKP